MTNPTSIKRTLEVTVDELTILRDALDFIRDMPTHYGDLLGIEMLYDKNGEVLEEDDEGWTEDSFCTLSHKVDKLCSSVI